jgi:hypothetical protein
VLTFENYLQVDQDLRTATIKEMLRLYSALYFTIILYHPYFGILFMLMRHIYLSQYHMKKQLHKGLRWAMIKEMLRK